MRSLDLTTFVFLVLSLLQCMAARKHFVKEITEGRMQNVSENFWTSGSDWAIAGEWNWSAMGVPIAYNGWAPGTPAAEKRCLWLTDSVDYKFSDFMCETRGIGFICEEFFKSKTF
ncbi:hypothetical protein B566_EDAN010263 [Ephemera danica]|nr:hypothetical protein B566_EDAN010263 [Ephemera danica]